MSILYRYKNGIVNVYFVDVKSMLTYVRKLTDSYYELYLNWIRWD